MIPNKPQSVLDFEQAQARKFLLAAAIAGIMPWTLTAIWDLIQLIYTLYEAWDGISTAIEWIKEHYIRSTT